MGVPFGALQPVRFGCFRVACAAHTAAVCDATFPLAQHASDRQRGPLSVGGIHAKDDGRDIFDDLVRFAVACLFVINFRSANGVSFGLRHAFQRAQHRPQTPR